MKTRKKFLLFVICGTTFCVGAVADSKIIILSGGDWWKRIGPSVCRVNTQTCYSNMKTNAYCSSIGNPECWDADANCWGKKYICENALSRSSNPEVSNSLTKSQIASGKFVNSDFDVNTESNGCFGVRKTYDNGSYALVNGNKARVWCNDVPLNSNEIDYVKTGKIVLDGDEPTCESLSQDGFAAIKNGSCWGKQYNNSEYYIDCKANILEPYRIIILNNAPYDDRASTEGDMYETLKNKWQTMLKTSKSQHDKYFK
ncbi:MAG: hypothetical protein KBS86_01100 [Proteobacteria bacterium]|nr:hypothetical protein [Candidatus Enterousia scatequi]